MLQTKEEPWI